MIPRNLWEIFDVEEAEMIIYGVPFINLDEWKEYTDYEKPYTAEHKVKNKKKKKVLFTFNDNFINFGKI